jgi:uroporphyrinogen-III decarboxylase
LITQTKNLPIGIVFHPNWWYKNYNIHFGKDFFYDPIVRVDSDLRMRRALSERFPDLELGVNEIKPRPVVGGTLLAAGYIISNILGCEIHYFEDAPPEVIPVNLTDDQVMSLNTPNIIETPVIQDLIKMFDTLQNKFGYLEGDINWEGIQNVALNLRGQQLFIDYLMNPELAKKLLDTVYNTIVQFLEFMKTKTNTTSISVNRIVQKVDPEIHLHSNCTVTMISADNYREFLFPYDKKLSEKFQPFGIHYCGTDMHKVATDFAKLDKVDFFDVGWESDIKFCRKVLPDKFLSLRLSPERMQSKSVEEIEEDIQNLLKEAGPLNKTGLCCVNMDFGTPDENIRKLFEISKKYNKRQ